jgi:penicillin-binding protein 1C
MALEETSKLSAASIYATFDALKEVYRPGEESGWRHFTSSKKIAWKTGTSFGYRDGWAVGSTPRYTVGVWVGNADGEGRSGLTGTEAAAPIMFDIFSQLNSNNWFKKPIAEMTMVSICSESGHRATARCTLTDTLYIPRTGLETRACPYHQTIHLSKDHKYRVNSACASIDQLDHVNWFVLSPVQEYYYKPNNTAYKSLPPFRKDCITAATFTSMELIYPKPHARIFIPRGLDGKPGSTVFELAHKNPNTTVYWHLDNDYIGVTKGVHTMPFNPKEGSHILTLIDDNGEVIERAFQVISGL